jgi:hypothetical protein
MQPEWKRTSSLFEYRHCKVIFARSKLTMDVIQSVHADFCDLPNDTRYSASANSSNPKIKLLEGVTIDGSEQSQQEGTDTKCINQKALLTSDKKESPDWVTGLEGKTVTCEDVTFNWSNCLPILVGYLNATARNGRMASLSALLILAMQALSMEPRPTRI